MHHSLSHRWARLVTRHWWLILLGWVFVAITLRLAAPPWNDVAYDGDFDYLPAQMSSVAGGKLLDQAFPGERSRSQIVLVLARQSESMHKNDQIVGLDLLRRLYHRLGEVSWQRAIENGYQQGMPAEDDPAAPWVTLALEAFGHSIEADKRFYESIADSVPDDAPTLTQPRMAIAYWDRGRLLETIGDSDEAVEKDFEAALVLMPRLPTEAVPIDQRPLVGWKPMLDVLSWDDRVIGSRLRKDGARLAVMQLSSELAATGNIATIEAVDTLIDDVLAYSGHLTEPGLELLMTGSAAIGGETLMAARDAIRYTEWITVVMILLILAAVYRAPLLVAVPMISIGFAVLVSTSLVALLTGWSINQTVPRLDMRIFTTSRIFIVVILFGAGTDYCLFLIARLREEAAKAPWVVACRNALSGVMGALFGSAMTTVVGLGMLWIASFGKFHYTGPIIAICLLVGLLVCTTLTPALLRMIGPVAFWPSKVTTETPKNLSLFGDPKGDSSSGGIWSWIALMLTRRPMATLVLGLLVLGVPAVYGFRNEDAVTYDFSSQLNHSAKSRQGLRALSQHFDIGEINPVTVLIVQKDETPRKEFEKQIKSLAKSIYSIDGMLTVRTSDDPLGDFPPDRDMGLLTSDAWKRRALRNHRVAKRYFFSSRPELENRLARLDVVVDGDPFSIETAQLVSGLGDTLHAMSADPESVIGGAEVLLAGTTPSIIDLRSVTLSDNRRIKIAVVLAVFAVLVLVIRRLGLCLYLIATVLISYYATLGLTLVFFKAAYGADFVGLDWKLPLFLFVILVAVGQDYNVYLVTRIVEEQRKLGWLAALRRAVSRTGGIITACGLVMAATFFSMTASAWFPPLARFFNPSMVSDGTSLRGIVELGFALGLGVLIDTFYVRTILVPSFVAAMGKRGSR
ncbi:Putative membrane protein YdgH [Rubripirellula lacrimiformis]|uniref:Membrane protein YdgH n=1 Tax=Rubripirellula lacrimiformis TaxID=1930273 RepID=A0A517N443_9BACT|nr:MMPL family transporter [Rubripirellula lacrimiformis]QDT01892.1 Putative membrane protein YdgH [Rubripirellula lacrimiformis]